MAKMKVLQINCVYNEGSTGKIVFDIHNHLLKRGYDSIVFYGRGAKNFDFGVKKITSNNYCRLNSLIGKIIGITNGCCLLSTRKIIKGIKKEKPDIVHLHCINGNFANIYRLLNYLKKENIKTVITLHAEFFYTGGCTHAFECDQFKSLLGCVSCSNYKRITGSIFLNNSKLVWNKLRDCFSNFNELKIISVSDWLRDRASKSTILANKEHLVIKNGIDTDVFSFEKNDNNFSHKRILFVTPYFTDNPNHIKGGDKLIQIAKDMINENIEFIVVGKSKEKMNLPSNITLIGEINNDSLAHYYSICDRTILLSKRETFSMVVAESLCCGTPVFGIKCGGPESFAPKEFVDFIDYKSIYDIEDALKRNLKISYDKQEIAKDSAPVFSNKKMCDEYEKMYLEFMRE